MFKIEIKNEGKSMEKVAKEFNHILSQKEIAKTAVSAINITANRARGFVKRETKKEYSISNKWLDRVAKVTRKANPNASGIFAEISYSYKTIPMAGFKYKANKKNKTVTVEIKKGVQKLLRHAFVATMRSGHTGIWSHGDYSNGKFVPNNAGKITELRTASPFTMYTSKQLESKVSTFVGNSLASRYRALLQNKVNKLKNK